MRIFRELRCLGIFRVLWNSGGLADRRLGGLFYFIFGDDEVNKTGGPIPHPPSPTHHTLVSRTQLLETDLKLPKKKMRKIKAAAASLAYGFPMPWLVSPPSLNLKP